MDFKIPFYMFYVGNDVVFSTTRWAARQVFVNLKISGEVEDLGIIGYIHNKDDLPLEYLGKFYSLDYRGFIPIGEGSDYAEYAVTFFERIGQ
ncbi:hypothetical protein TetV_333 [Tetraselmis virus 1]|uniref:Uncharacterized protein n=1 Tax=Tetraselmis virus 1 TaxID=2060617 RepID=A0A2P0VNE2_9VIRU|nr:hypothetical protein QJ968_gp333 [Tetraselmis virus 1]AUF82425.1 hypothetical protein TetV_333 [Tetraselmis virus 1]